MGFQKAIRERAKLRLMIDGPAKAGKTTTALRLAILLGRAPAVIDAEQGKAALCVGEDWDGVTCEFSHSVLTTYSPMEYTARIQEAAAGCYDVLVIDGLSPAWDGIGGALEMHDASDEKNSFFAWRPVTRAHRRLLDAILNYPGHVICTMRSKMAYVAETNSAGKSVPRRIGLAPVQRAGIEYEFDLLASMDQDHVCTITGARCQALDGLTGHKPGEAFWKPLFEWLSTGQAKTVSAPRVAMATDDQVRRIRQLWIDLEKTQRVAKAQLFRNFTVNEVHQLTELQANNVLQNLEAEAAQLKKPSPAPAVDSAAASPQDGRVRTESGEGQTLQQALATEKANGDAAAAVAMSTDKNTALQRLAIARDDYFPLVGLPDGETAQGRSARREMWAKILERRGVKSATALEIAQIQELTAKLESMTESLAKAATAAHPSCAFGGYPAANSPPGKS